MALCRPTGTAPPPNKNGQVIINIMIHHHQFRHRHHHRHHHHHQHQVAHYHHADRRIANSAIEWPNDAICRRTLRPFCGPVGDKLIIIYQAHKCPCASDPACCRQVGAAAFETMMMVMIINNQKEDLNDIMVGEEKEIRLATV
jgi:hypothetical protein